jgi:oligopeptide transport system substrate-binding protein
VRKFKASTMVLAIVLIISMALTGCGGGKSVGGNTDSTAPDAVQTLSIGFVADVRSLDSAKVTDLYSATALLQSNDGLVRITNDGTKDIIEKAGAESWTVSQDGLVWTFKLRDQKWSDGQPVTAKDYEYAWKRVLNPKTKSGYAYLINTFIKGEEELLNAYSKDMTDDQIKAYLDKVGVKAVDDKTFEVTLTHPVAYFDKLLGMQTLLPQREDKVKAAGETYGQEPSQLVYNGPFIIKEWVKGSKMVLEKNPQYWDTANVKLQTANILIIKDEGARMKAFETGVTDAVIATGDYKTKYMQDKTLTHNSGFEPSTTYIFFNCKDPDKIFTNRNIRLAFSLALNREEYSKAVMKQGVAAYGWAPFTLLNGETEMRKVVSEPLKEVKDDPKALLTKGMQELGLGNDPGKLTVTYLNSGTTAKDKTIGEYLQNTWQTKLGVNVKLDAVVDFAQYLDRVDQEQFQIGGMAWSGDYNDPMTFFDMWTTPNAAPGGNNAAKWENKEYDALVEEAQNTTDMNKRLELFTKMEKMILVDEAIIAPELYRDKDSFIRPYVKNLNLPLFGPIWDFKTAYTAGR